MRSAMIQEDGMVSSSSPVAGKSSYGAAGDQAESPPLVGRRESQGPIYSAM
ncbi:Hypothetical protein, putative [Bodo saltans]|uniref:Uncharacterized protein n=1 Tax=Bodo saltans TaxID=75058 RepID=A0A0S4JRP1_BODSA|nr:Hypothetical protein, putative [Bodo saltans]|eukprot:CUG91181.1 Hypothetical protein, putative [Bodo saltans]